MGVEKKPDLSALKVGDVVPLPPRKLVVLPDHLFHGVKKSMKPNRRRDGI